MTKEKIIFLGNGKLADYALGILKDKCEVVFHARTKADLANVAELKKKDPSLHAVLASFGVLIKSDLLELFEPEGILNIHPSLLPLYRGASPIESAILAGDTVFSVSVMKLVKAMDAGPIYHQETLSGAEIAKAARESSPSLIPSKDAIYKALAEAGATWVAENLPHLPTPKPQNDAEATFTTKLTKEMGLLSPDIDTAEQTLRKIIAYEGYPKARYTLYGKSCLILRAHLLASGDTAPLTIECADGQAVALDTVQPEGKRPMDAKSFLNGYAKSVKNA